MRLNHLFSQSSAWSAEKKVDSTDVGSLDDWILEMIPGVVFLIVIFSGADSGAETHVPFPNTVVKGSSGDGTV